MDILKGKCPGNAPESQLVSRIASVPNEATHRSMGARREWRRKCPAQVLDVSGLRSGKTESTACQPTCGGPLT